MMETANKNKKKLGGMYLHIPFCIKKCNYCAFCSYRPEEDEKEKYVKTLIKELELRKDEIDECDTIYFGGGTPSLLTPTQIDKILQTVFKKYSISQNPEITIEANPATLTANNLIELKKAGINRLSMGFQSMNNSTLKKLGRVHSAEDSVKEFYLARKAGFDNINLDIIFSVPGTNCSDVIFDLEKIIKLGPEHISFYSLQLEEGTPFFEEFLKGELEEIDDSIDRMMYHLGCDLLKDKGYEHYEISNFCKKGFRSRHNSKYWNMNEYLGIGLGASSFIKGIRKMNTTDAEKYYKFISKGEFPFIEKHVNSLHDNISEAIFTGLRRAEGIKFDDIITSKEKFLKYYKEEIPELCNFIKNGDVVITNEGLYITEKGIDISNKIMALFV